MIKRLHDGAVQELQVACLRLPVRAPRTTSEREITRLRSTQKNRLRFHTVLFLLRVVRLRAAAAFFFFMHRRQGRKMPCCLLSRVEAGA